MSSGLATDSASSSSDERKSSASSPLSAALTGGTGGGASFAVDEIEVEAREEVRSVGVVGTADPRVRRFRRLLRSSWKRGPSQLTTCTVSVIEQGTAVRLTSRVALISFSILNWAILPALLLAGSTSPALGPARVFLRS